MVHGRSTAASLAAEIKFPAFDYVPYPVARPHRDGMTQEAARRYLALPSDGRILLAFGATRFDKGADVAVASLTDLPRDVHLVVAGRPTDFTRADLERRAQAQGTSNRLHVRAGFIADDDVSAYFAASNVVLAPYRRQFTGQSGPVTIAATMAIPVVATDADVLRETVSEYGLGEVCRPEDPSALAAAVRRVLDRRPVPEAERFVREHDLTAFGDAVRASYHKALRAARTRT